jgi:hypothetical protein
MNNDVELDVCFGVAHVGVIVHGLSADKHLNFFSMPRFEDFYSPGQRVIDL